MEKISKSVVGRKLPCKRCGATATINLEEGRYHTYCVSCGENGLLCEYHITPKIETEQITDI